MRLPQLCVPCRWIVAGVSFFAAPLGFSQGSRADYERAANLRRTTANTVFRDRVEPHWLPGNTRFWYEVATGPGMREYVLVDAEKGERRPAFDHARLARALQAAGLRDVHGDRLVLRDLAWPQVNVFAFAAARKTWRVSLDGYEVLEQKDLEAERADGLAPQDAPTRSLTTGEETSLHFHNRTAGEIELFWLDLEGRRRSYGRIAAGQSRDQPTRAGHVWVVDDVAAQRPLVVFEATSAAGEAIVTGPVRAGRGGMAPEDGPTRSRTTGAGTPLRILNRTAGEVELFWLDTEGKRRSYGSIAPGQSSEQGTYVGHVWLVVDAATRRPLVVFEATRTLREAIVTGPVPSRNGRAAAGLVPSVPRNQSPDGKWSVSIKNDNVVLREVATGTEFELTADGTPANAYRDRFAWSPDSKKLVGVRAEPGEEHKVAFVESSPTTRVQPVLHTLNYYKPGDKLPHPRPVLWHLPSKERIPIDDALFPNPFTESDAINVRWERDSSRFIFRYNQRGHQVLRIIAIDAATGAAKAIVDEQSRTFITHSSGKAYAHPLEESNELIWMSERDGWNHLYLYDAKTGAVKNQITRGEWVVRSVDFVDPRKRQVWFQAGGIVPGQDPYYVHYLRVNFDGTGLTLLTEGDGTHGGTFSPDRRFVIDRYSRVDQPAIINLRRTDTGRLVCELERAQAGALFATGWRAPERFVAKGRDNETDIYGIIIRPTTFDSARKYPVVEHIYAGPHGASVPKAFSPQAGMQEMAELGFIIVQIDGMGTSHRSKKFHDVCWQNLVDAGLPDRVRWIKAAAATRPEMDLSRVGIYGGSAGGQNSLGALLTHGDFYKVAVSDCGCHDNRMDKIWWNEQWMGWPVGPHYEAQSNVTLAPRLQGKLLLIVGEVDRNVDPASTMQVANALVKANKDFDLLVIPGAGHGAAGTPYGKRRQQDFFVRHLHGREPRWVESASN